ncbi:Transcription factor SPT8 [Fusarium oxysporum f. sp. albedinis]|nr:Transcription factor SPT8 [Fusarium oxysporum f. sp. albedinis]
MESSYHCFLHGSVTPRGHYSGYSDFWGLVRHETAVRRLPKTVDISEAQRRYHRGSLTVQRYVALSL